MSLSKKEISLLQQKLNLLISNKLLDAKRLDTDGIMGPKTIEVIKTFQSNHNLVSDGIYGFNTEKTLNDLLEKEDLTMDNKTKLSLEDFKDKKNNKQILIYYALESNIVEKNELAMFLAQKKAEHQAKNKHRCGNAQ